MKICTFSSLLRPISTKCTLMYTQNQAVIIITSIVYLLAILSIYSTSATIFGSVNRLNCRLSDSYKIVKLRKSLDPTRKHKNRKKKNRKKIK